jgi:hypothetical protein
MIVNKASANRVSRSASIAVYLLQAQLFVGKSDGKFWRTATFHPQKQ